MTEPNWPQHCGDDWRAAVLAATGRDICAITGPSPRRPRDWAALMRRLGARCMADVVTAVHGPAKPVTLARRGDIVQRGWALGLCRGELAEFYGGDMVPLSAVERCWPIDGWAGARCDG